ncbi:apolipoprotein M [Labrus bergylta]|uniref:apolipoprotein M n=1 Tax=Labrus bergylta TaxID=56723 RepID=UPI003313C4AA
MLELYPYSECFQYLGKWYFKAAVSYREADIQIFRELDNVWYNMEQTAEDTLLLTGHMHIIPSRKKERRNLLWTGKWANCPECIIVQEIEPPLHETDSEDSLGRHMLYSRQRYVNSEVVKTFLQNAACQNMVKSVQRPQQKGLLATSLLFVAFYFKEGLFHFFNQTILSP